MTARTRSVDLDVVRAIALIGVCVMNYHGYLNPLTADAPSSFVGDVFNPWRGPLATRFAATFVTVAGMGVVLLTRRAMTSGSSRDVSAMRWVLVRRGFLLLSVGFVLDWVWPGTILFFYGGYFLVAAVIFTWSSAAIASFGVAVAVAAAALKGWASTHPLDWLLQGQAEEHLSLRELVFDLTVRGTHPLLPWLSFLCLGILLQRHVVGRLERRVMAAFIGVLAVAAGYGLEAGLPVGVAWRSTHPFGRALPYVLTACGTATVAVVVVGAIARATESAAVTRGLAVAGRSTLSLYLLHVVVFRLVVDTLGLIDAESGLDVALTFALVFWVMAVAASVAWTRIAPIGPAEWVYRRFSDHPS